jgi:hypothetical protein
MEEWQTKLAWPLRCGDVYNGALPDAAHGACLLWVE